MHIRLATRSDLSSIATIASRAMMKDELSLWLSPQQAMYPRVHRERCLRMTRRRYNAGMMLLVAVTDAEDQDWDGSETVVGYAAYEKAVGAPDDTRVRAATWNAALERFLYRLEENYIWYFRGMLNTDKARWRKTYEVLSGSTAMNAYEKYWELDLLAVDPDFGRRGIGGKLLDWGQDQATKDGVPLLLWASLMALPLYVRKGFKEIDRMVFCEEVDAPVMVWLPEGVKDPRES